MENFLDENYFRIMIDASNIISVKESNLCLQSIIYSESGYRINEATY